MKKSLFEKQGWTESLEEAKSIKCEFKLYDIVYQHRWMHSNFGPHPPTSASFGFQ
jgi:hypothetical protein